MEFCVSNHVHHDFHEAPDSPQRPMQIISFRTIGMTATRFGNAFERFFAVSEPLDVFPTYVSGIDLFAHGVEH